MIKMKDDTELVSAWSHGYPVHVYDDGWGPLWIFGAEHGPEMLIRARSFEEAWEIAIDELPDIPTEEIPEAHGFDGWNSFGERTETEYSPETAKARFDAAIQAAQNGAGERPELMDGYEHAPNGGIKSVSCHAWLREAKPEDFRGALKILVQRKG